VDLLREEFAMPVEELNPFRKVLINPAKHSEDQIRDLAPKLVVAVGLALRSFD
jgi:Tfp pilus assembly PilM family ATPase